MANTADKPCLIEECVKNELFSGGNVGLFVVKNSPRWNFEDCSENIEEITGYSPQQIKDKNIGLLDLVHPEDKDTLIKDFQKARRKNEKVWDYSKVRLIHREGKTVWVSLRIHFVENESGRIPYFVGYIVDITEEVENRKLFETLTDFVPIGIFLQENERLIYVNKRSVDIVGYFPQEIYQMESFFNLIHPEDRHTVRKIIEMREQGYKGVMSYRIRLITKEGRPKWVQINSITIEYQNRILGLGTVQDIDRVVQLEFAKNLLSEINRMMLSIRDRDSLLEGVCEIFKEYGEFRGIAVFRVEDNRLSPECMYSRNNFLSRLENVDIPEKRILKIKKPLYLKDIEGLKDFDSWKEIMRKNGVDSLMLLPVIVDKKLEYVISVYIHGKDYYMDDVLDVFSEISKDISFAMKHIKQEEDLFYKEFFDSVTQVGNRTYLLKTLEKYTSRGRAFYLIVADIYNFRYINEKYGKEFGDKLLRELAQKLDKQLVYENVFRIGSDEFAIVSYATDIYSVVNKIKDIFEDISINNKRLSVGFNLGIVRYPDDGEDINELLIKGERTVEIAKKEGKNKIVFFDREKYETVVQTISIEEQLEKAIKKDEFILYFQPILSVKNNSIKAFEVLIRWKTEDGQIVLPEKFIQVAESTGQIKEIDKIVVLKVLKLIKKIENKKIKFPSKKGRFKNVSRVKFSVNITPRFIKEFVSFLTGLTEEDRKILSKNVVIELTERESFEVYTEKESINRLKKMGFKIAIDDFGTGYSSLSYISELKINYLKIDKIFINKMLSDRRVHRLVQSIINIARTFGIKTVAEGVETKRQLEELKKLGCDKYQGYYFSPPVSQEEFEKYIG
ncbi:PAS domain S-box-containing protein/diguanylate cyclase (GGDEF) domain-containing protein [Persephonella hydrogeniphila]|uniref:PAS domain S-box-containing protein/diguanylate cyclase (GGDEF) domain-containing protein n=1 Tax=Persephonella hydrogeniphila TaxID=198703 RepID=A0A285NMH6_9AQUI|nr:GGDEF domain-containing phosphodiesterase [Persephonella hydrogeniphila]SNZ10133.1 PAS domain S-box-containing protein/diguanylate cyclase (GGDEF) domain-containing protein [Persephonella hydrogeniphila]